MSQLFPYFTSSIITRSAQSKLRAPSDHHFVSQYIFLWMHINHIHFGLYGIPITSRAASSLFNIYCLPLERKIDIVGVRQSRMLVERVWMEIWIRTFQPVQTALSEQFCEIISDDRTQFSGDVAMNKLHRTYKRQWIVFTDYRKRVCQ